MKRILISGTLAFACTGAWAHDCECTCKCADEHEHSRTEPAPEPAKSWKEWGWYAGGSLTFARFDEWSFASLIDDGSYSGASNDDSANGFRIHAGANLLPHVDVELGYADYGEAAFTAQSDGSGTFWAAGPIRESTSISGVDATLVARLNVTPDVVVNGRLGVLQFEVDSRTSGDTGGGPFDIRDSGSDASPIYGVGIDYDGLRPLRMSASYMRVNKLDGTFSIPDDARLASTALTLTYLFQ